MHGEKGRVKGITVAVIFGDEEEIAQVLEQSPVGNQINVPFVERNNLTLRQHSRRLTRKADGFSKKRAALHAHLCLFSAYYHFVEEHRALRIRSHDERRKWQPRTPALAAGITDHVWNY